MLAAACPVSIHVGDRDGKAANNITILIDGAFSGHTDALGTLMVELEHGNHTLQFFLDTVLLKRAEIYIDCKKDNRFDFELGEGTDNPVALQEVTVEALTARGAIAQSPFSVQAIDLKGSYDKGGDISEVLNRASGIRLRSDGGVGAPVQINLGGLQGKAVRLFKDGIPIELFGHGFSLGTIPVNMLERVEIYKGAMQSEEHTSELQSLMRISYAVFCLKKKIKN